MVRFQEWVCETQGKSMYASIRSRSLYVIREEYRTGYFRVLYLLEINTIGGRHFHREMFFLCTLPQIGLNQGGTACLNTSLRKQRRVFLLQKTFDCA